MAVLNLLRPPAATSFGIALAAVVSVHAASLAAAEKLDLSEPAGSRIFAVRLDLSAEGTLTTRPPGLKPIVMKLDASARFAFRERRLDSKGRGSEGLRSLRVYDAAAARARVDEHVTDSVLREERRTIVARGSEAGVVLYSPSGPLTRGEIDLLDVPADSLAVTALLPGEPVEVGDEWTPPRWALPLITGTDAVINSDLKCRLKSVAGGTAIVTFSGKLEGTDNGAATKIEVSGRLEFDLTERFLRRLELTQKEQAGPSPVAPELDVEASVSLTRSPTDKKRGLGDAEADRVSDDPPPDLLLLEYHTPWNIRFQHGRDWHLFKQTPEVGILRLIEREGFLCQVNISKIPHADPGRHTPEDQFQRDIRRSLGPRLKEIAGAGEVSAGDGRFIYRVTALGQQDGREMMWIYYLFAAPSGRQAAMVFSLEAGHQERLAGRDLAIARSVKFLSRGR